MSTVHFRGCTTPDSCWCEVKRALYVCCIAAGIFTFEIAGGLVTGSLALIADAWHVFADNVALMVLLGATLLVRSGVSQKLVYGVGYTVSVGLLAFAVGTITIEGLGRLNNPPHIEQLFLLVAIATLGGIGNVFQFLLLRPLHHEHAHGMHTSIVLHILSDLGQSVAVVLGGIGIWLTGFMVIDPILSLGIAVWISYQILKLLVKQHLKQLK